jgi:hypothetical protein
MSPGTSAESCEIFPLQARNDELRRVELKPQTKYSGTLLKTRATEPFGTNRKCFFLRWKQKIILIGNRSKPEQTTLVLCSRSAMAASNCQKGKKRQAGRGTTLPLGPASPTLNNRSTDRAHPPQILPTPPNSLLFHETSSPRKVHPPVNGARTPRPIRAVHCNHPW